MDDINNPLGTDGFEFVEFTGPQPQKILKQLQSLGFHIARKHKSKNVLHLKQNDINFILNMDEDGQASEFSRLHGPSANAMAFRVKDAAYAINQAYKRGAKIVERKKGPLELDIPCIEGIGGSLIYLIDRYGDKSIYDIDFIPILENEMPEKQNLGLYYIDHLTHNVRKGEMDKWSNFYEKIFNFREIRHFDIEGKVTGLLSKAMTSPCGKIRIPINESKSDTGQLDQIAEFIERYNGEGIQHIALGSHNLLQSVDGLKANGVDLQDTIETYYDLIDKRLPNHGQNIDELKKRRILIDGDKDGLLLQIFSKDMLGPIFFEFIERKGNQGFGEGNFRALFESIELDQIRRGIIKGEINAA